jgi:N utilization substance protein A
LSGWDIEIMTQEELAESIDRAVAGFSSIEGIPTELAEKLVEEGFLSYDDLSIIEPDDLMQIGGLSEEVVEHIIEQAEERAEEAEKAATEARRAKKEQARLQAEVDEAREAAAAARGAMEGAAAHDDAIADSEPGEMNDEDDGASGGDELAAYLADEGESEGRLTELVGDSGDVSDSASTAESAGSDAEDAGQTPPASS